MILRQASTAAATALALYNATFPGPAPYPPQAILCYDKRYARDPPP